MIPTVIVHCHPLGRSLDGILARVPDAVIFDAPVAPEQHAGCIAGHQYAVRLARERHWAAVGVVEDDCEFTASFSPNQWMADIDWAREHGYHVVNGGVIRAARPRVVRSGLVAVDRFKSTHCVAYLPPAFDVIDRLTYPMDVMIGRLGAASLITVPFVAVQGRAYSAHLKKVTDYRAEYAHEEARLLGLAA